MENAYGIDTSKIKVGDRVEVVGCAEDHTEKHWGTILGDARDGDWHIAMDNNMLQHALDYYGAGKDCYLAYGYEITQHLDPVQVFQQLGLANPDVPEPSTADVAQAKVVSDINETLRYLQDRTGSEWVAATDGIQLDISAEGDYAGTMHVRFIKKEIE